MKTQPITLKDIARDLNLSASTVSRAMRNHPAISVKTRKMVQEYAEKHHFKPNTLALKLRTNKSNTIGVIIPQIIHYFFSTVLAGIQDEADSRNYNLIFCHSNEEYEREVKSVETLLDARVCGIIVSQSKTTRNYEHFQKALDYSTHLVFFDRMCAGISTDRVVVDDYYGAYQAVDYLVKTGCRRIAFLGSDFNLTLSNNRRLGYEDALRKNKIQVDQSLMKVCDTIELAQEILPEIIKQEVLPDAFFCINDEVAAYCIQIVKQFGYKIPDDISVCGFTNSYIASVIEPKLTTVDQHGYELGKEAVKLLIDRIEGVETKQGVVSKMIKTELVKRKSTR